jgi:hypothetical protein
MYIQGRYEVRVQGTCITLYYNYATMIQLRTPTNCIMRDYVVVQGVTIHKTAKLSVTGLYAEVGPK